MADWGLTGLSLVAPISDPTGAAFPPVNFVSDAVVTFELGDDGPSPLSTTVAVVVVGSPDAEVRLEAIGMPRPVARD